MTCTFCGSILDGNETECPYCGHKVDSDEPIIPASRYSEYSSDSDQESEYAVENEDSDLEYAEDYEDDEYAEEPEKGKGIFGKIKTPKINIKSPVRSQKSSANPSVVIFGLAALCLLFSLVGMFVSISTLNHVKDIEQDMNSQLYVLQSDIKNTIGEMQSSMTTSIQTATAPDPSGGVLRITHSPTSVDTVSVGDSNKVLFNCNAEGYDTLTFSWEKKSASGEWVAIKFDESSRSDALGLMVYDQPFTKVSEEKYSQITAVGLTEASAGDYRCKVSDKDGHYVYSDVATLYL